MLTTDMTMRMDPGFEKITRRWLDHPEELAAEFAKDGVRFNSVQPGSISSGMTDGTGESKQSVGPGLPEDANYRLFGRVAPLVPLEKGENFAKPDAVAAVVAMLGSADAFWVSGTEVRVDGGAHM